MSNNNISKYVAISGAVYVASGIVRMIYVTPWLFGILAAAFLLLCALSGEAGDDLIRYGLVILAWIAIIQVIKLAMNGRVGLAFVIGIALFCLTSRLPSFS
jgi:hypothetical protein